MDNNFEILNNYINDNIKININLLINNIFYMKSNEILKCKAKYLDLEFKNNFDNLLKNKKYLNSNNKFENENVNNLSIIYNILFKIIENINNINKLIYLYESDYFIIFNNKECLCKCKNINNINIISNVSICIDLNELMMEINKENSINLILKTIKNNEYNKEKENEPLWNIICNL